MSNVRLSKMIRLLFCASLLTLNGLAYAGAWGEGSFDNDDALDWVAKCTQVSDISVVSASIDSALKSEFIEAPEGSEAIAATEVVAAALGKPNPKMPAELKDWLVNQQKKLLIALRPKARLVLARIKNPKISELHQLWSEGNANDWLIKVNEIEARLGK